MSRGWYILDSSQNVGGGVTTRFGGRFEIMWVARGERTLVESVIAAGRTKKTLTLEKVTIIGVLTLVKAVGIMRFYRLIPWYGLRL